MNLKGKAFEVAINIATQDALMREVSQRFAAQDGFALATLNLDHVTKLEREQSFRDAYGAQDLVVADGNPIVWLSKLAGTPVALLPGSELVEPLAQLAARQGVSVALIGSSQASLQGARVALQRIAPGVNIAMCHAPEYGFDPQGPDARALLAQVDALGIQLVFIALGAPKQEMFAALGRELAPKAGFASIGAGLDFLSGTQARAPKWVRALALEWFWRMMSNPKRMFKRYGLCALCLPGLALRVVAEKRGRNAG